jgi:hypothetical protein
LDYIPSGDGDPATLFVKYTNTINSGLGGATTVRFGANENITGIDANATSRTLIVGNTSPVGQGTKVSNGPGDFFVEGHFVFVPSQTIILSKYSANPTVNVGFIVTQDIVSEIDNLALYDNQGDVPNITAPGAHRYRIQCLLSKEPPNLTGVSSAQKFILYAEIKDGVVVQQSNGLSDYNRINDLMALRTKEESGDYIAKPFNILFEMNSDNSPNLTIDVSSGTAYINGYR